MPGRASILSIVVLLVFSLFLFALQSANWKGDEERGVEYQEYTPTPTKSVNSVTEDKYVSLDLVPIVLFLNHSSQFDDLEQTVGVRNYNYKVILVAEHL